MHPGPGCDAGVNGRKSAYRLLPPPGPRQRKRVTIQP